MWTHHTDQRRDWKHTITSDAYIVRITGGSIIIMDRKTQAVLKTHKGHHYLYTGDISPDQTQCFALENGKHFYVYSLRDGELIKRVTLPRGCECIDMYGLYTEDGKFICIPASKWIGREECSEGYYEYVMCKYETQQFALTEKSILEDRNKHRWNSINPKAEGTQEDWENLRSKMDAVTANLNNKDFLDRLLGIRREATDQDVEDLIKFIFDDGETK